MCSEYMYVFSMKSGYIGYAFYLQLVTVLDFGWKKEHFFCPEKYTCVAYLFGFVWGMNGGEE